MSAKTYSEKLKDPRWQKVRLSILERDGWECRDCGNKKKSLQVHHCYYEKGNPWDTRRAFLLTLCESCHADRQENEENLKKAVAEICATLKPDHVMEFAMKVANFAHHHPTQVPILMDEAYAIELHEKSKGVK